MNNTVRGFFGIGIENGKTIENLGTLWRSAHLLGADYIFTIGRRYKKQYTDTSKAWKSVPLWQFDTFSSLKESMPRECLLIGVELDDQAEPIQTFTHPERAAYLLGAEDNGLKKETLNACHKIVRLPGKISMNVASAGTIVMYDRLTKLGLK